MSDRTWSAVGDYIVDHLVTPDPLFDAILKANAAAGLPPIDVSPAQGKFLNLLVRISGARRVLEIGTLGGYSTVWMARALREGGAIVSLEFSPKHAAVATANLKRAGVEDRVTVRVGPALDTLPKLMAEGAGPFDFIFIDADKPNNPGYLDWAIRLARPGTVVVLDNVIRDGRVIEAHSADPSIAGTRAAFELLKGNPRIDATALQTVGAKGYDGFAIGIVT